jgi:hypothetical protein
MGKIFELIMDHKNLKYLFNQSNMNSKKERWMKFPHKFDFNIKHVKGKENKFSNALSRMMRVANFSICKSNLKEIIIGSLVEDKHYVHMKYGM